jgi:hypothetical protein
MNTCRFCLIHFLSALAALALGAGCAVSTPALQAPSPTAVQSRRDLACVGDCLTGQDPFDSGCAADARTVKLAHAVTDAGEVVGMVELRQSGACGTVWARVLRSDGRRDGELVGGITVDGGATWLSYRAKRAVALWTDMHAVPARGCIAASALLYDASGRSMADEMWASNCGERRASLARTAHDF